MPVRDPQDLLNRSSNLELLFGFWTGDVLTANKAGHGNEQEGWQKKFHVCALCLKSPLRLKNDNDAQILQPLNYDKKGMTVVSSVCLQSFSGKSGTTDWDFFKLSLVFG